MKPLRTTPALAAALILLASACSHAQTAPRPAAPQTGYDGPVLVSADERSLTIGGYPQPCPGTVTPVAVETSDSVRIFLHAEQLEACAKTPTYPPADITLSAPLSGRVLLNGATGARLGWFNARHLIRPVLPAGFTPMEDGALIPYVDDGHGQRNAGAEQIWADGHGTILALVQTSSADTRQLPAGCPDAQARHLTVRGLDGIGCPGAVIWLENGTACEITTGFSATGLAPMPADRLAGIADSAPSAG